MSIYQQVFADGCHSNYIEGKSDATGNLAWSTPISERPEQPAVARTLLTSDGKIIVDGKQQIFAFDQKGTALWRRDKWIESPVVLNNDWLFYISASRKDHMNAIDLNNVVRLEQFVVPNIVEGSFLILFAPYHEGLIAQVQHTDMTNQSGMAFIVFNIKKDESFYQWSKLYIGEKSHVLPIVCIKKQYLLTTTRDEAHVFYLENENKDPEPVESFPLPFGSETSWVSGDASGNLIWVGAHGRDTKIVVTDIKGKPLWNLDFDILPAGAIAPPVVTPDSIFILTERGLTAVHNSKRIWRYKALKDKFTSATALADGTVLVIEGNTLHRIDANGEQMFSVTLKDKLVASPVIDEDGHIYVTSTDTLYAIH